MTLWISKKFQRGRLFIEKLGLEAQEESRAEIENCEMCKYEKTVTWRELEGGGKGVAVDVKGAGKDCRSTWVYLELAFTRLYIPYVILT